MASVKPWPKPTDAEPARDNGRAAIYRERAAHLRAMAEAEPDPELRAQLLDLARQYEDMADSAGPAPSNRGLVAAHRALPGSAQRAPTAKAGDGRHQLLNQRVC
jgi:hypothetical protein